MVLPFTQPFLSRKHLLTRIRWHVFTAIGGYTAVAVIDLVTSGEVTEDPVPDFAWPVPLAARLMSKPASSVKQS
jgi:dihydroceramidase